MKFFTSCSVVFLLFLGQVHADKASNSLGFLYPDKKFVLDEVLDDLYQIRSIALRIKYESHLHRNCYADEIINLCDQCILKMMDDE